MLEPDLHVASVTDVSVAWLRRARGGAASSSTPTTPSSPATTAASSPARGPGSASCAPPGLGVAILSNGTLARVADLGATLGVPAIALAGKPFGFGFRRAMRHAGHHRRGTAMVGDQLFTDVLGARWAGMTSVLVTPLTPGRHAHTRVARRLERWVLAGGDRARPLDR
jgi:uncharacterized protein